METHKLNYTLFFPPFGGNVGVRNVGGWQRGFGAFILAILFYTSFPHISAWKSLFLWITITTFFEFLQPFITGGHRQFEWLDICMNIIGFTMGLLIFNSKKIFKSVRSKQFL